MDMEVSGAGAGLTANLLVCKHCLCGQARLSRIAIEHFEVSIR